MLSLANVLFGYCRTFRSFPRKRESRTFQRRSNFLGPRFRGDERRERLSRRSARGRARRSPRPECPRRARSARFRRRRAAPAASLPSDFRLWRSILRRWPKAASVTRCSARESQASGCARGIELDHRRRHLRRRHEGARRDVEQDARLAAPADQHRQPAVALGAGLRHEPLGDLALEHQHQPVVPGRPRLAGQPGDQQRGGDVVGQVGDDARRRAAEMWARIVVERVAGDDLEPAGIALGDLGERGDARGRRARSRSRAVRRRRAARG